MCYKPTISTFFLALLSLTGCPGDFDKFGGGEDSDGGSDSTAGADSGETGETGDSEAPPDVISPGSVSGRVYLDLYTTDETGATVALDWEEAYPDGYPFGSVFVSTYTLGDDGKTTYRGTALISDPNPDGSEYTIELGFDKETQIYVEAQQDYWGDGLIAPYDPLGEYGDLVTVYPDDETKDIDIHIDVPYYDFSTPGGPWDPDAWILISGDAEITREYGGGSTMALVYDTTGYGPYGAASFDVTATDSGAAGTYSVYAPKSMGEAQLLAAWDDNLNGIIDPSDQWGGYTEDGVETTSVVIGTDHMDGYKVSVPLTSHTVAAPPNLTFGGVVHLDELTMALITSSSELITTAMRFRPGGTFDPIEKGKVWDDQTYSYAEISENNHYELTVPSDTVIYLWSCVDVDGDGYVNEPGESCGQPVYDGKIATGSEDNTAMSFWIHTLE